MIRALFFDVDDTLLDFDRCAEEATRACFTHFGLSRPANTMEEFFRINNVMWKAIEDGTMTHEEHREKRWNTIFAALGISFDGPVFEDFFRIKLTESYVPVEGAPELLASLSGQYTLCVASNASDAASQRYRLTASGIMPYLSHCFLSGELGAFKPSPAFFDACFSALPGIAPHEVLFLGDSPAADMAGGKACGLSTCLFDPKGFYPHCPDADFRIRRLCEFPEVLRSCEAGLCPGPRPPF